MFWTHRAATTAALYQLQALMYLWLGLVGLAAVHAVIGLVIALTFGNAPERDSSDPDWPDFSKVGSGGRRLSARSSP